MALFLLGWWKRSKALGPDMAISFHLFHLGRDSVWLGEKRVPSMPFGRFSSCMFSVHAHMVKKSVGTRIEEQLVPITIGLLGGERGSRLKTSS